MQISIQYQADEPAGLRTEGQSVLDRLFPRGTTLSWLLLDWEPGSKAVNGVQSDGPIGRWVVRQMVPERVMFPDLRHALQGPDPRGLGEWKYDRRAHEYFWYSRALPGATHRKWELYHQYRCEARIFWVIQGAGGGHPAATDAIERKHRRLMRLPPEMPAPGGLPYAPPDWRVWDNILDRDQVRQYTRLLDITQRTSEHLKADDQQAVEDLRWALYRNWCRQVDWAVDERAKRWWAHARTFAPKGTDEHERQYETTLEQFVTDLPLSKEA